MNNNGTLSGDCALIQSRTPVIHNITNYVAMGISANALLAIGASPLMSSEAAEMKDISRISDALVINIGCIETRQVEAAFIAAEEAFRTGKPWVLDPVGAGVSRLRLDTSLRLIREFHPSVIRGNASEILALCGKASNARGVDSRDRAEYALECAFALANGYAAVVSVSGPTDLVTDGTRTVRIEGGSGIMAQVSAMGCTASALVAAFASVEKGNFVQAATGAMELMATAGRRAAAISGGPGSFAVNFIDALHTCSHE